MLLSPLYMLLSLCVNVVYVSVIVCNGDAGKCHHCCGAKCCCDYAILLPLLLYVATSVCKCVYNYVHYGIFDIAASECCHCCNSSITVTVCSATYATPLFPI